VNKGIAPGANTNTATKHKTPALSVKTAASGRKAIWKDRRWIE